MSRVRAFDIAVVAQKVKVVNKDRCDLKMWGGVGWVSSRSGWLLKLLTELTRMLRALSYEIMLPKSFKNCPQVVV